MAEEIYEEQDIYTLTDEEGNESQFELLASTEVDGVVYLALEPMDDNPDDSYVILKLVTDENGEEMEEFVPPEEELMEKLIAIVQTRFDGEEDDEDEE